MRFFYRGIFVPARIVFFSLFFCSQYLAAQAPNPQKAQAISRLWQRAVVNYQFAIDNNFDLTASNFQASHDDFSEIISIAPAFAEAYFMRGAMAYTLGRHLDSFEDVREAFRLKPALGKAIPPFIMRKPSDSLGFAGLTAFVLRDFAKADSLFMRSESEDILSAAAPMFLFRAVAKNNIGQKRSACRECQKALVQGLPKAEDFATLFCNDEDFVLDNAFPSSYQFFPREANDSALVRLEGMINRGDVDSVFVIVRRETQDIMRLSKQVVYAPSTGSVSTKTLGTLGLYIASTKERLTKANKSLSKPVSAPFSLLFSIKAECKEYSFELGFRLKSGLDTIVARRDSLVAGDVVMFAGQSNMVLGNVPVSPKAEFMRTLTITALQRQLPIQRPLPSQSQALWQFMVNTNSLPFEMGHIGGFGGEIARRIVEDYGVPIFAIHAAVGATAIEEHSPLLSPQKKTIFNDARKLAQYAGVTKHIRGVVWYQGESNSGSGYDVKFLSLHNLWKRDFTALKHVYLVQIRPNVCNQYDHSELREEQRRLAGILPGLRLIASNAVRGYDGCHFNQEGYETLGKQAAKLMGRDFYGDNDTLGFVPPMIQKIAWKDSSKTSLILDFAPSNQQIFLSEDSLNLDNQITRIADAFLVDGYFSENGKRFVDSFGMVESVRILAGQSVELRIKKGVVAERVSYVPETDTKGLVAAFQGPWLQTNRGVGVLSFYRVPVQSP